MLSVISLAGLSIFFFSRKEDLLGLSGRGKEAQTFLPFLGVPCVTDVGDDVTSVPFFEELDKSSSIEVAGVVGLDTGIEGDEAFELDPLTLASLFDAFNSFEILVAAFTDWPSPPHAHTDGKGANSKTFFGCWEEVSGDEVRDGEVEADVE